MVCGDPARVDRVAGQLEGAVLLGQNREFRLVNGRFNGRSITVCSDAGSGGRSEESLSQVAPCGGQFAVVTLPWVSNAVSTRPALAQAAPTSGKPFGAGQSYGA